MPICVARGLSIADETSAAALEGAARVAIAFDEQSFRSIGLQ
jgi:hypothetical protein